MMLIELLGVLIIFGLFSIVASEVWYAAMHITADAHDLPRPDRQAQAMIARLRTDVWSALELGVRNDHTLTLDASADRSITWSLTTPPDSNSPTVRRTVSFNGKTETEQTWDTPALPIRFIPHGPGLRLEFPPVHQTTPRPIDLYSQLVQLAGAPQ